MSSVPENWSAATFGEVINIHDSERIPVSNKERQLRNQGKSEEDLYPYYGATGKVGLIDGYLFDDEYVLLGEDAAPFLNPIKDKAYLVSGKFWVNNHAHVLSGTTGLLLNKFILHQLNTTDYKNFVTGTTRLKLSQAPMKTIPFLVAPYKEQERIVSKIEELFSGIEAGTKNLVAALEKIDIYKRSVLKYAFEGKLLDVNFVEKKVKDLCEVVRGGSPRPAGDPRYYDGKIPFIKVADLTKDSKVYLDEAVYSIKEAGLKRTRLIKKNTLLLTNSGATLGIPKISRIEGGINDGVAAFLNLDDRSNLYFYYFFLGKTLELRSVNRGAAQPNLNTTIIGDITIPYCNFEEQEKVVKEIERHITVVDKISESIQTKLNLSKNLRTSVLKKAFAGKLVKQDPNDEPASVLLERIKEERAKRGAEEKAKKKTIKKAKSKTKRKTS